MRRDRTGLPAQAGQLGAFYRRLRFFEDGRDWRKLTRGPRRFRNGHFERPQEILQHFRASKLPPSRRPKGVVSGLAVAAGASEAARHQGLCAAVAVGILQAVEQGCYWAGPELCRLRLPMSCLRRLPPEPPPCVNEAECLVSRQGAVDVCLAYAQEQVSLVRLGEGMELEQPLLLRSSYLKAIFEMERQIHEKISDLEDLRWETAIWALLKP